MAYDTLVLNFHLHIINRHIINAFFSYWIIKLLIVFNFKYFLFSQKKEKNLFLLLFSCIHIWRAIFISILKRQFSEQNWPHRVTGFAFYSFDVSIILSILFIRFFVLLCSLKTYLDISHKDLKNGKQQLCFLELFKHPYWNTQGMHQL